MGVVSFGTSCLWSEVGRMTNFNLWRIPWGGEEHGVQGQICDILRPQPAMNRFLPLPATQIPTLWIHTTGRGGGGCSDIGSMSSIQPICKCQCPPLFVMRDYLKVNSALAMHLKRRWLSETSWWWWYAVWITQGKKSDLECGDGLQLANIDYRNDT
jgi:hypothetical protein